MRTLECTHVANDESCAYAGCQLFLDNGKFEMEVCKNCLSDLMSKIGEYLGDATAERTSMHWQADARGILRGVYYAPVHRKALYDAQKRREAYELVQADLLKADVSILHVNCNGDSENKSFCAFVRGDAEILDAETASTLLDAVNAVLDYQAK